MTPGLPDVDAETTDMNVASTLTACLDTACPDRSQPAATIAAETADAFSVACTECDLAMEADHRIANHLALLGAYVEARSRSLQRESSGLTAETVQLVFSGLSSQIDAISRLHRALAMRQVSPDLMVGEFLHHVCEPFTSGLSGAVVLSEDFDLGCRVCADHILPLTQIASELISNAIKYSHPDGGAGNIWVRCLQIAPGAVEVRVEDDGPGLPKLFDPAAATGLGFRLIRGLAAQIGAEFGVDSSPSGSSFWLRVESAPLSDGGLIQAR